MAAVDRRLVDNNIGAKFVSSSSTRSTSPSYWQFYPTLVDNAKIILIPSFTYCIRVCERIIFAPISLLVLIRCGRELQVAFAISHITIRRGLLALLE